MKILRVVHYFIIQIPFVKKTRRRPFEIPKSEHEIVSFINWVFGRIYRFFQNRRESIRVYKRNTYRKGREYSALTSIISGSKEIISFLFIGLLLSLFVDWIIFFIFTNIDISFVWNSEAIISPDEPFVLLALQVCVGAVSAILGLIFALYAVGFQLTTEKYSSSISDYIGEEPFSGFLFKFLVFTDLFAVLILLRTKIINLPLSFSFIAVIVLVFISLLSIIIFKNDFVIKLKPKAIYGRLIGDLEDAVRVATERNRYTFRSWSIIQHARRNAQELLTKLETIFEDLWRAKSWNDVIYAPTALAIVLTSYARRKKFIDIENGWWFPKVQKEVKGDDMATLPIKLNFELESRGPLRIGTPDYQWFENTIFKIMQGIINRVGTEKDSEHLMDYVINAHQVILTGDSKQDKYGRYKKDTLGMLECQELSAFERYFDSYLDLYKKVTDEDFGAYINGYFAIGLVLVEGFSYTEYEKVISSFVREDGKLFYSRGQVLGLDLPALFHGKLVEYWDRLNLEITCEGRVVTPPHLLKMEMLESLRKQEKEWFKMIFKKLSDHQEKLFVDLYKKERFSDLAILLKVRLEWFGRLLFLRRSDVADDYALLLRNVVVYLTYIPRENVVEAGFWEEVEKLMFQAVNENRKGLVKELAGMIAILNSVVSQDEKDIDKIIYRNRLSVIIGGYIFLWCELRQDRTLLIEYVQMVEKLFNPGYFIKQLEVLSDPKSVGGLELTLKLINWESTRYHHWFGEVCWKIEQMQKKYDYVESYSGMQQVADHPSDFIRAISYHCFNPEEKAIQAYVEWVKRREAVKDLIVLLKNKK